MHEINSPLDNNKNTAIISLAWPFATARAPEKIWGFLKKLGIVKNLNFLLTTKVRHLGIHNCTGQEHFV